MIDQGYFIYPIQNNSVYKINIYTDWPNYSVYSIALSHPELTDLKNPSSMTRLDVFCPTYDMLKRYKENGDWEAYTKDYWNLLKARKNRMAEWAESLVRDRIYFLCCWENTSGKAHCHREILYQAMKGSKIINEKSLVIYRKGNEIKKRKREQSLNDAMGLATDPTIYTNAYIYVSNRLGSVPALYDVPVPVRNSRIRQRQQSTRPINNDDPF